jgi:hypothetical protein
MEKECCHALLDYILIEDVYKNFKGLADSIGGFWDHYKARNIVGLLGLLFSLFYLIFWSLNLTVLFNQPYSLDYISIILIFIISILICWDARRIRKEVELREFLLILKNKEKLNAYFTDSAFREECKDP